MNLRQPGTGQWLLDSSEFQDWLADINDTLYCSGMPGAGKTFMTATVIHHLTTAYNNNANIGIAYIYCDCQNKGQQNINDLFASFLKQLTRRCLPSLPESVQSLYDACCAASRTHLLEEILSTLRLVFAEFTKVFILVDALDECESLSGYQRKFLTELLALQKTHGVKLFVTSRQIPEISDKFKNSISMEIRASREDVKSFVGSQILEIGLNSWIENDIGLQEKIKSKIADVVHGMFLLAYFHCRALIGKTSRKAINKTLDNLSTALGTYDRIYQDAMQRINDQEREQADLAKRALCWIAFGKELFSVRRLQYALAIEENSSALDQDNISEIPDILSLCAGLLVLDRESSLIRLVHYTAQEYLERKNLEWFPTAESDMATSCVTYLSFHEFINRSDGYDDLDLLDDPFYSYAAWHWGTHAREAETPIEKVIDLLKGRIEPQPSINFEFLRWASDNRLALDDPPLQFPQHTSGLHVAAYFGLLQTVEILLKETPPDVLDLKNRTPIFYAPKQTSFAILKVLLDHGAKTDLVDTTGNTLLSCAVSSRHLDSVKLLLNTEGIDVNQRLGSGATALMTAADSNDKALVELLLAQPGIEADPRNYEGETPLISAVLWGNPEIVALFLNRDDVDLSSGDIDREAGQFRHLVIPTKCYAYAVINTEHQSRAEKSQNSSVLAIAAESYHFDAVKLLLSCPRVQLNRTWHGRTALSFVAGYGSEEIVAMLIRKEGVDIDGKGDHQIWKGKTPLAYAAEAGHAGVVRRLLELDAVDPDSETTNKRWPGRTPLSWAAAYDRPRIVELLLETGKVAVDSLTRGLFPPGRSQTVMAMELEDDELESVMQTSIGRTPLSWAAERGSVAVIEILLKYGANPLIKDCNGWTPLFWACNEGHAEAVILLLANGGVDVNQVDLSGRSVLSYAAEEGRGAVVEVLLATGKVDLGLKDDKGMDALSYAFEERRAYVIELICDYGVQ